MTRRPLKKAPTPQARELPLDLSAKDTYLALITDERPTGGDKPGITLTLRLHNDDGTRCVSVSGGQEVTTRCWMPLSGNRFNQYIGAIFPEFDETGGEFDDGDLTGRCVMARLSKRVHATQADAASYGAELEVDYLECVPIALAPVARRLSTGAAP